MQVTLIHNGYYIDRRKLYPNNPLNNLKSSLDLTWMDSVYQIPNKSSQIKHKIQERSKSLTQKYNELIQKKIQKQLKIDKSSFRVLPSSHTQTKDSLKQQLEKFNSKTIDYDAAESHISSRKEVGKNQQNFSKSIFGYDINLDSYNKKSYLSKILDDKLEPFLRKQSKSFNRYPSLKIDPQISIKF